LRKLLGKLLLGGQRRRRGCVWRRVDSRSEQVFEQRSLHVIAVVWDPGQGPRTAALLAGAAANSAAAAAPAPTAVGIVLVFPLVAVVGHASWTAAAAAAAHNSVKERHSSERETDGRAAQLLIPFLPLFVTTTTVAIIDMTLDATFAAPTSSVRSRSCR